MLPFNKWRVACLTSLLIVVLLFLELGSKSLDLKSAQALLEHPKRVENTKVVRVQGPVRIREIVVERSGEKRTEREEIHEASTLLTEKQFESTPQTLNQLLYRPSQNRLLFGACRTIGSNTRYGLALGVSLRNRVDVLFSSSLDKDEHIQSQLFLVARINSPF